MARPYVSGRKRKTNFTLSFIFLELGLFELVSQPDGPAAQSSRDRKFAARIDRVRRYQKYVAMIARIRHPIIMPFFRGMDAHALPAALPSRGNEVKLSASSAMKLAPISGCFSDRATEQLFVSGQYGQKHWHWKRDQSSRRSISTLYCWN